MSVYFPMSFTQRFKTVSDASDTSRLAKKFPSYKQFVFWPDIRSNYWWYIFSCKQAALQIALSVGPSIGLCKITFPHNDLPKTSHTVTKLCGHILLDKGLDKCWHGSLSVCMSISLPTSDFEYLLQLGRISAIFVPNPLSFVAWL